MTSLSQLFACLLAAHVFGDFLLQSNRMVGDKRRFSVLVLHAGIVALLSYLVCGAWESWSIPLGVFVAHAIIDAIKVRIGKGLTGFLADQSAHLLSLVGIAWLALRQDAEIWGVAVLGDAYLRGLVVAAGAVIAVLAGGAAIALAVKPLVDQLESRDEKDAARRRHRGFENGGRLIGQLERALIFLFVLVGQPSAIGFLVAAKSIFRFGELKDTENRMEAEYILIGTLMSFGVGCLVAFATRLSLDGTWIRPPG